jgi:hypothetical protein
MVLADGGVVCIDEFDKMNEDDRVAIHEVRKPSVFDGSQPGPLTNSSQLRFSVIWWRESALRCSMLRMPARSTAPCAQVASTPILTL